MFNAYAVRPIGSARFEEHLLDIMTSRQYAGLPRGQEDFSRFTPAGSRLYHSVRTLDPGDLLVTAVAGQSVCDYLLYYVLRKIAEIEGNPGNYVLYDSRCLDLENGFFRKSLVMETLFEELLRRLHKGEDPEELLALVESNYRSFMFRLGGMAGRKKGRKPRWQTRS